MARAEAPPQVERPSSSRLSLASNDNQEFDTDLEEAVEDCQKKLRKTCNRTTGEIYSDVCSRLDIVPASKFLRQCITSQVDLKHYGISDKGAQAVAKALEKDITVKTLNLHDNGIGESGTKHLSTMLKENCFITHLDLSGNAIGNNGTRAIGEMLWENGALQELNLTSCGVRGKDVRRFSDALGRNITLKSLICSYNDFGDQGAVLLASGLRANRTLRYLDLSWNNIRLTGVKTLAEAVKVNQQLRELDLSCNYFLDAGATALGKAIVSNRSLKTLCISNCGLQNRGAFAMAKAVRENTTLEVLKIGKNPFQSAGVCAVLKALRTNKNSSLNEVKFDNVAFDQECKNELDLVLKVKPNFSCSWDVSIRGGTSLEASGGSTEPMDVFLAFVRTKGLRLFDLFKMIASDPTSKSVTKSEFTTGLKKMNVPLNDSQIRELYNRLDENGDGAIEFHELHTVRKFKIRKGVSKKKQSTKAFVRE